MKPTRLDDLPDVLRPQDVIDFTRLNKDTVYALLRCGRIQNVKAGRVFLIPKWALRAFLEGGQGGK